VFGFATGERRGNRGLLVDFFDRVTIGHGIDFFGAECLEDESH
jgi:hypothetical protein